MAFLQPPSSNPAQRSNLERAQVPSTQEWFLPGADEMKCIFIDPLGPYHGGHHELQSPRSARTDGTSVTTLTIGLGVAPNTST